MSAATPDFKYVAYIDEAGDTGLKAILPDPKGASEWLMVAGVIIRAHREHETADWNNQLKAKLNSRQLREVHFADLNPRKKLVACEHVAGLPVRCFVVASHKRNMKGWRNPFAEKIRSDNWFYCWMTRLLLERMTHWVEHRSLKEFGQIEKVKLVYSARGGLSYAQMNAYYEWLRTKGENQVLTAGNISYETIHHELLEVANHVGHNGLKLPDIVASSFFKAADIYQTKGLDNSFAKALSGRMARSRGMIAGYGVKLIPRLGQVQRPIDPSQLKIFRYYGYPEQWWDRKVP